MAEELLVRIRFPQLLSLLQVAYAGADGRLHLLQLMICCQNFHDLEKMQQQLLHFYYHCRLHWIRHHILAQREY